ncbi:hypothetical protein NPIL_233981, partial [Nephila pilipes]
IKHQRLPKYSSLWHYIHYNMN